MASSKTKLKTVYKIKWKNMFKFILIILIIGLTIFGIVKLVDIYTDYKDIDNITLKAKNAKQDNLVDDNSTTIIKPSVSISKFDEYYNYIKLGMLNIDMNALKKINPDIVGYIEVKGTSISYPVVHGNNYYKSHSLDKTENINGSIYVESNDFKDITNNTVIYGNLNYFNTIFGDLNTLFKSSWQDNGNNYVIKFYNENYTSIWEIVSIYKSKSINNYDDIINKSVYDFNTTLNNSDKLLTLVGLKNNNNVIVHAKLIKYKKLK